MDPLYKRIGELVTLFDKKVNQVTKEQKKNGGDDIELRVESLSLRFSELDE